MPDIERKLTRLQKSLDHALRLWSSTLVEYTTEYDTEDALYWYNERASLSVLATSLAQVGSYVLEEYRTEKGGHGATWTGRADIWFEIGENPYIGEAKQLWVSLTHGVGKAVEQVDEELSRACEAAKENEDVAKGCRLLGIVFAVPYLAPTRADKAKSRMEEFVRGASKIDCDAIEAAFLGDKGPRNKEGYVYPGALCCVRQAL